MNCTECGMPIDGSFGAVCLPCAATEDAITAGVNAVVEFVQLRSQDLVGRKLA